MAVKIIEDFTPKLVLAISDCVLSVTEECLAKGLISTNTNSNILKTTVTNSDKTRNLVEAVKKCIEIDNTSFDLFLRILDVKLPSRVGAKLLSDMRAQLASRAEISQHVDTALVPLSMSNAGHGMMTYSMYHGQLSVPHAHDVSRVLSQEQGPYIGKLEESIRQQERAIAEMKLLKEKLEKSDERLKGDSANRQSSSVHEKNLDSTMSSMSEADMIELKEKIKSLEKKSDDLDMAIRRYKNALDMKGEEIARELMIRYDQKIQELNRKLERQYESYNSREWLDDDEPGLRTNGKGEITEDGGKCNSHLIHILVTNEVRSDIL